MAAAKVATMPQPTGPGLQDYLTGKIEELEFAVREKSLNLKRLEAQRNKLNGQGAHNHAVHVSLASVLWHKENV